MLENDQAAETAVAVLEHVRAVAIGREGVPDVDKKDRFSFPLPPEVNTKFLVNLKCIYTQLNGGLGYANVLKTKIFSRQIT